MIPKEREPKHKQRSGN